jgi:outer membrane protein assembly factor BamB
MKWLPLALMLLLSACASKQGLEPKALESFEQQASLDLEWERQFGDGPGHTFVRLAPAAVNGTLYVANHAGEVTALSLEDGDTVWSTDLDDRLIGGVQVAFNQVYISNNDGELIALSADKGVELWRAKASSEILSQVQATESQVIAQSIDGRLFAFNASDGQTQWEFDSSLPVLSLRGTSSPLLLDDRVIAGFANGKLVSINLATGQAFWEERLSIPSGRSELERLVDIDSSPLIIQNMIYSSGYQGELTALQVETGRVVWSKEVSTALDIAEGLGNLYVVDDEGHLHAFDEKSGTALWVQNALHGRKPNAAKKIGTYLAVADFEGYVHLFSLRSGEQVERHRIKPHDYRLAAGSYEHRYASANRGEDLGIRTHLLVVDRYLVVYTNTGRLQVLNLEQE